MTPKAVLLELFLAVDAGEERLFDGRAAGERSAPWIQERHGYVFRLYDAEKRLLAALPVTRVKAPPFRLFAGEGAPGR